ncbi:hypothetical protein DFJ74DRAFT_669720 [Hyaloraphidium curvatum]|nr:hypothetical protein DFJ74DRAFT_669720 [Hyaloraphidium curvatum]
MSESKSDSDLHSEPNSAPIPVSGSDGDVGGTTPSPNQRLTRAAKLASVASSWSNLGSEGDLVTRNRPRSKPKRANSVVSEAGKPMLARSETALGTVRDASSVPDEMPRAASTDLDASARPGSIIPQRRVSTLLLRAGTRARSPIRPVDLSSESPFAKVGALEAEDGQDKEGDAAARTQETEALLQFPPLSSPFKEKRKSMVPPEKEKEALAAVRELIEREKEAAANQEPPAPASGGPKIGVLTFHPRTIPTAPTATSVSSSGSPILRVFGTPDDRTPNPDFRRASLAPSIRSRARSDADSIVAPSLVTKAASDTRPVAENIVLPFQRADNSLKLWLSLKVLGASERLLGWAPGSYFLQTPPSDAEAAAMQQAQGRKSDGAVYDAPAEFAAYFLATSTSLRIYTALFDVPYREAELSGPTYVDPAKYVKLREEIPVGNILRVDVCFGGETIVLRTKRAPANSRGDRSEVASYIFQLRDAQNAAVLLEALRIAIPPEAGRVWNEEGWWTGLNAVYDLEFASETLALYSTVGHLDPVRRILTTCSALSDGTTFALSEERWQVWPPLLFPPERLGESRQWVNQKVGKVPKKGLLADIIGQFSPPVFACPLAEFDRAERWSVRRVEFPDMESWMVQGGLVGGVVNRKAAKARAAAGHPAPGTATGWQWAVKLFFRTTGGGAAENGQSAAPDDRKSATLLFATVGASDRFLTGLASALGIGWVAPGLSAHPGEAAQATASEGTMFSSSTKL